MLAREVPERVLFLTGEAGIGKSTLIKQLLSDLETDAKPPIVATAECSTPVAGSSVGHVEALKPFADIMSGLVEAGAVHRDKKKSGTGKTPSVGTGSVKGKGFKLDLGKFFVDTAPSWIGLIPVIGAPIFHALSIVGSGYDQVYLHNKLRAESASAASNQEQVFRQYINFLKKLSEQEPILLILDDFHWADTSSTNLLFAAARDLSASNVVFLVVYREAAIKRSASQEEHPILHVRNEIERYAMSRYIEVPQADQNDLRELLLETYPAYESNGALEQWLLRISDGNLLFASQFLLTLDQDQYLEPKTAVVLKDLDSVPIPSSANAIVVEHIRRLGDEEKEQLRNVSVEGETITTTMASRILDMPMLKMIPRLRLFAERLHVIRLIGTQTLYAIETTTYQFMHFLVHKALYDDLIPEERVLLHGVAADVLEDELIIAEEAQHNVHIVTARLAAHSIIALRLQRAAEVYLKGAQWVWRSFSADEALHLVEQCITTVHSQQSASQALRAVGLDALLLKAEITQHRTRYTDAAVFYEEAITLANDIGTPAQRNIAYSGYAYVKILCGNYTEAEANARIALQIAVDANDWRSRVRPLNIIGVSYFSRSMYDQALDYYQQSLQAAIETADEVGRANALLNMGIVYGMRGTFSTALEHYQASLSVHRSLRNNAGIMFCLSNIGVTLGSSRKYHSSLESLEEALSLARTAGDLRMEANILTHTSVSYSNLERLDEALDLAQQGLAIHKQIGSLGGGQHALAAIGDIYKNTNRLEEAMDYYTRSMQLALEVGNQFRIANVRRSIAYLHLLGSRYAEALALFDTCIKQFAELGIVDYEMVSAIGSAWCSLKLEALETTGAGAVDITTDKLLAKTKTMVREEDFNITEYERICTEWIEDLSKFGVTMAA